MSFYLGIVEAIVFARFHSKLELVLMSEVEKRQMLNKLKTKMRELFSTEIAEHYSVTRSNGENSFSIGGTLQLSITKN